VREALVFIVGVGVGLVFGMVIQWIAALPREYRR
jgi:hypothetical protein